MCYSVIRIGCDKRGQEDQRMKKPYILIVQIKGEEPMVIGFPAKKARTEANRGIRKMLKAKGADFITGYPVETKAAGRKK